MGPSNRLFAITLVGALVLGAAARTPAQVPDTQVVNDGSDARLGSAQKTTNSTVNLDGDAASWVGHHHYNSDAERAQDDLIITEVKSALAEDGISKGYPVEVDADHGRVTLNGVVASREDVKAAAEDAADVQGVVAVRNLLRPH